MKLCQMVVPREEDESEGVDALMRAARARASPAGEVAYLPRHRTTGRVRSTDWWRSADT